MTPPELDDRIVGQVLRSYLPTDIARRLVLIHGRYAAGAPARFSVDVDGADRSVAVSDQQSVLGVAGAWQDHRDAGEEAILVVTTGVPDRMLGWDVRGHALKRATLTVDRADIVAQRFGAQEVEPRVRREPWLLTALLEAEPVEGWGRTGPVLTHATAVRSLVGARFGFADAAPDAGVLLEWSRTSGPARLTALSDAEQDGLASWLTEAVGPFATVFTALVRAGRATDVLPLGLLASLLDEPGVDSHTVLSIGQLLAGVPLTGRTSEAYVAAVLGTLERWITLAEGGGTAGDQARAQVLWVLDRADTLARDVGLDVGDHPFLPAGFERRLADVATALNADPDDTSVVVALGALERLREHRVARLHPGRVDSAAMAVRLMRWLARTDSGPGTVAQSVAGQLRTGGWVDRALTAVWAGEATVGPTVSSAYGRIHAKARERRDRADEHFAARLKAWAEHASTTAPGGALLVEDVLETVVVPLLADDAAPLVVVIDGMSAAVATELGEQIADRGWTEISRDPGGRDAAVAMIPSVTRLSRTSLLTGRPTAGDRVTERDGFQALWQRHRRKTELLHKGDIAGTAGHRLSERLLTGLADGETVVGVVLNTVDDALDHGREGDRVGWRLHDITYLPDLLAAARSYGRPVVVVSDHGHVLERSTESTKSAPGPSARWRTGEPADGEVALRGPRVLEGDGRVVVPWREDIRYTNRKAGYHGGASLAEMTVPVLVFVPTGQQAPLGFSVLPREVTRPDWWNGHGLPTAPVSAPPAAAPPRKKVRDEAQGMLDDMPEEKPMVSATPASSLGSTLVATTVFKAQAKALRRAPEPVRVAALIDAMTAAGGELTATAALAELGRAGRDPGLVLAHLQRLLNVEGYPVLSFDGRTARLDVDVLHIQFGLGPR